MVDQRDEKKLPGAAAFPTFLVMAGWIASISARTPGEVKISPLKIWEVL